MADHDKNQLPFDGTDADKYGEESSSCTLFFPPLYLQRYMMAVRVLTKEKVKSVVDFGCSECGFFKLLNTVPSLSLVSMVDVDRNLLMSKKNVIYPELRHFVHRRDIPLHNCLYVGSAEDTDRRIVGCEAVTMIEVIEHLHLPVLERVTHNVFGVVQPKLCIVTTPNSEFNILFKNDDPQSFRHWDHKFEWTRQEFRNWCTNVCEKYGYTVEFTGVGYLASRPETLHYGPCSQAAIFGLEDLRKDETDVEFEECYELVMESDFPYEENTMSLEEKIDLEVSFFLRQVALHQRNEECDKRVCVSRICDLRSIKSLCDEKGVRASLERLSHNLSEDGNDVMIDIDELLGDSNQDKYFGSDEDHDDFTDNEVLDRDILTGMTERSPKGTTDACETHSDSGWKSGECQSDSDSDWDLEVLSPKPCEQEVVTEVSVCDL